MIGDASGVIDPLTGSGMAMAIQSALLAAPFVISALNGDRARAEREYQQRHDDFFASRIRWSRRIAFLLSRPALLEATPVRSPALGHFLLDHTRGSRDAVEKLLVEFDR
jgi:flavin-dependent dehydrogenase